MTIGTQTQSLVNRHTNNHANEDNAIMAQVRDGDVARLGLLFERHNTRLYGFFVKHTGRRSASEDLVQEVFFRMLKYRHTFRGEAPFTVWMYQLARNVAADFFGKRSREVALDESYEEHATSDDSPIEALQRNQEQRLLHEALARLDPEKREVLVLSRFQDLKYEEIATILGVQVGTVKARVHRALNDLREEYYTLTKEI